MKRRHTFLVLLILFISTTTGFPAAQGKPVKRNSPTVILKEIHTEVKELGFYENESFLRREFHMNLDGNDTNKEEYVMVFSRTIDGIENMTVQVTYFEPQKDNPFIKHAVATREIKCFLCGESVVIQSCDYGEREIQPMLAEILNGIRSKKKLLGLIRKDGI